MCLSFYSNIIQKSVGMCRFFQIVLAKTDPDMEKGADTQTLSAEIYGDCGNYLAETPSLL